MSAGRFVCLTVARLSGAAPFFRLLTIHSSYRRQGAGGEDWNMSARHSRVTAKQGRNPAKFEICEAV